MEIREVRVVGVRQTVPTPANTYAIDCTLQQHRRVYLLLPGAEIQ
jgi:hypothetical protein